MHVPIVACSIYLSMHWYFARLIHLSINYMLLVPSIYCTYLVTCDCKVT